MIFLNQAADPKSQPAKKILVPLPLAFVAHPPSLCEFPAGAAVWFVALNCTPLRTHSLSLFGIGHRDPTASGFVHVELLGKAFKGRCFGVAKIFKTPATPRLRDAV